MNTDLLYQLALTLIPGVGGVTAKQLIAYCGSAKAALDLSAEALMRIPDVGATLAQSIASSRSAACTRAAQELEYADKSGIAPLSFLDARYPQRLRPCDDSPVVLFARGAADLNAAKAISIVGTRNATAYGRSVCEMLLRDMVGAGYRPLVVSGLAFGIDVCAHRAAINLGLPTVAVLGHGLDTLYPAQHAGVAAEMVQRGGALLSDFPARSPIDPSNFVRRNRIVAGMADATIVVESAERGGALITANMAFSYARKVFAVPGRVGDKFSAGCLSLIRDKKAAPICSAADVYGALRWDAPASAQAQPAASPAANLSDVEQRLLALLEAAAEPQSIDSLCRQTGIAVQQVSATLLSLEFGGLVKALPGKVFARAR